MTFRLITAFADKLANFRYVLLLPVSKQRSDYSSNTTRSAEYTLDIQLSPLQFIIFNGL